MNGTGQNLLPSRSESSLTGAMGQLRANDSTTSMDSQSTMVGLNNGPNLADPETASKWRAFCQMQEKEAEKTKRKRENSGNKQKPKKKRPVLTGELDTLYKTARNALG